MTEQDPNFSAETPHSSCGKALLKANDGWCKEFKATFVPLAALQSVCFTAIWAVFFYCFLCIHRRSVVVKRKAVTLTAGRTVIPSRWKNSENKYWQRYCYRRCYENRVIGKQVKPARLQNLMKTSWRMPLNASVFRELNRVTMNRSIPDNKVMFINDMLKSVHRLKDDWFENASPSEAWVYGLYMYGG